MKHCLNYHISSNKFRPLTNVASNLCLISHSLILINGTLCNKRRGFYYELGLFTLIIHITIYSAYHTCAAYNKPNRPILDDKPGFPCRWTGFESREDCLT